MNIKDIIKLENTFNSFREFGYISRIDILIIMIISEDPYIKKTNIAKIIGYDKAGIYRRIKSLIQKDLIFIKNKKYNLSNKSQELLIDFFNEIN